MIDRRMLMKVNAPEFDGKIPWYMYLRQFGIVVNGWNEKEKANMLVLFLRKEVVDVLCERKIDGTTLTFFVTL